MLFFLLHLTEISAAVKISIHSCQRMIPAGYTQNFDLDKKNEIHYHSYIFFILHLATKLVCSFTHSKTLFLAVVLDFVLLALIRI
jgi:hypothetical protein